MPMENGAGSDGRGGLGVASLRLGAGFGRHIVSLPAGVVSVLGMPSLPLALGALVGTLPHGRFDVTPPESNSRLHQSPSSSQPHGRPARNLASAPPVSRFSHRVIGLSRHFEHVRFVTSSRTPLW